MSTSQLPAITYPAILMNIYTQAVPVAMREAHDKVVKMLLPMRNAG
jgi:hypothetical protein